jgi:hypothetical protein
MRVFNRIFVTLLLVGLLVLGVYGVMYSFGISGYSLSNLGQRLGLTSILSGAGSFFGSLGQSPPPATTIAILAAIAVLGLVLLVLELKPRRPRKVLTRSKGVYMTRAAVRSAVQTAAENTSEILSAKVKAKTRRGAGAKVKVDANIRQGEDQSSARSSIREQMDSELSERGVPVKKIKFKLKETASQGEKARVN